MSSCALLASLLLASARAAAPPDWAAAGKEAAAHLSRLVSIKTVNPPGSERAACAYLGSVLAREKIPFEILEPASSRSNLVARLRGDGSRRPLLLLSHLDTVGADEQSWSFPPFSGRIEQGAVLGRGAIDDKSMVAAALTALALLRREGFALKRDVIFAALADEESGGALGARWMLERHPQKLEAEFALSEGGTTQVRDGKVRLMAVQVLEKRYWDIELSVPGAGGHAAVRDPDNPILVLSRVLARLGSWDPPLSLNPVTRAYLRGALALEAGTLRRTLEDALSESPARKRRASSALRAQPYYYAMTHDTAVPTVVSGGSRANVSPSVARANLNVRLLPGTDQDQFLEELRAAAREDRLQISFSAPPTRASEPMDADTEMFRAISRVAGRLSPEAAVLPSMAVGSTDAEAFRRKGVQVYGFELPLTPEDETRIHGKDERMPLEGLEYGVRFFYELIKEVGG